MAKVGNYLGPRGGELTWSLTEFHQKSILLMAMALKDLL
jgi:hypothetical protein